MIYLANVSEQRMLEAILAHDGLVAHLYIDDHVDAAGDTTASFTEMAGHGYTPVAIAPSAWLVTYGEPTLAAAPEVLFPFPIAAAPVNVYGVYLTWLADGLLAFQERLAGGPFVVANANDLIGYTPRLTLRPEA